MQQPKKFNNIYKQRELQRHNHRTVQVDANNIYLVS